MKHKRKVSSAAAQPMAANDIHVALETNNDGLMKSLDVCIPVCVYSYDRVKRRVTVLPLVKQAFYKGKWRFLTRQPFTVAIRTMQCGGFCIDHPLFIGDTGWVFSSDRDTFLLKDKDSPTHIVLGADRDIAVVEQVLPQKPMQPKIHSLTDGFFIPDNWGKWEFQRFKDADDVELKDALYIGTSFFDEDEAEASDDGDGSDGGGGNDKEESGDSTEESDESDSDVDDETYEGHPSASIVMTRKGAVYLMASSKESAKKKAKFRLNKDGLKVELENEDSKDKDKIWKKVYMSLKTTKGVEIDCKGDAQSHSFKLDSNGIEMKYKSEKAKNGKDAILTISPALDINITSPGDVKVSAGAITTECKNITAIGENTSFNIKSLTGLASKVTINASDDVSIRSLGTISLASSEKVNIGAAGDVAIGCVGSSGRVSIETHGGDLSIDTGGGDFTVSSGDSKLRCEGDGDTYIQGKTVTISSEKFYLNTNIGVSNDSQFLAGGRLTIT